MIRKRKLTTLLSLSVLPVALLGISNFEAVRSFSVQEYLDVTKSPILAGKLPDDPSYFAEHNGSIFAIKEGALRIRAGEWDIDRAIVLEGDLIIDPGTTLNFAPDSYLLIHGAIQADGTEDFPITLQGKTGRLWKGLYIHEAESASHFKHVTIANTSALKDGYLNLTGGVTFYKSDLLIENSNFQGSQAEDGLNIIASDFSLHNTRFEDMRSDALDSDFSQGVIKASNFNDIGGDAIDLSGSKGWVEHSHIYNVRDKAISAGENSLVNVLGGYVKSVGVAAASKDGSVVDITDTRIENVALFGLMTYIKKPSYPNPILNAYNLSWGADISSAASNNWIRQAGTLMTVNGQTVPEKQLDVKALYRGPVMAK